MNDHSDFFDRDVDFILAVESAKILRRDVDFVERDFFEKKSAQLVKNYLWHPCFQHCKNRGVVEVWIAFTDAQMIF